MSLNNALFGRRSIRAYTEKDVSDEQIKSILKAGMNAPSGMNNQPWRFLVIRNKNILAQIPNLNQHASMAKYAPASILVCADTSTQIVDGMWTLDCSACIQNMLLKIHDLGLGGVWTGVFPMENLVKKYKEFFKLPEEIMPHSLVIFGHPAEKRERNNKYNQDFIHYDNW